MRTIRNVFASLALVAVAAFSTPASAGSSDVIAAANVTELAAGMIFLNATGPAMGGIFLTTVVGCELVYKATGEQGCRKGPAPELALGYNQLDGTAPLPDGTYMPKGDPRRIKH